MRRIELLLPLLGVGGLFAVAGCGESEVRALRVETLVGGLDTPWDLVWGPDGHLWFSERDGRISRLDPVSGALEIVAEIDVLQVLESGLLGLAFHPDFEREPWVYAVHSYDIEGELTLDADGLAPEQVRAEAERRIRNRLVRMRYDGAELGEPQVLLDDIPGRFDHNGSRLVVGPDGHLYMTTGDAGRSELARDPGSPAGKILRLTLEGQPAPGNPFDSIVYSLGHRNPQGLAFHPGHGSLYATEHGASENDELNRIAAGADYGWPLVRGFCDGDWADEEVHCDEHPIVEPVHAWTPTLGIAGIDVHSGAGVPAWEGDLLVTSLRAATLHRLELSDDGGSVVDSETILEEEYGRLRDVLVGPGGELYVATSNRDGRGLPGPTDDRILRVTFQP
ncbi:MAG: PQQ-dependent sugar dehydrogenase [Gemmatimonadota bacterium]|nr:PQQ-dependent sugar dehydrogenase [Gemmatimonadota bacterium]